MGNYRINWVVRGVRRAMKGKVQDAMRSPRCIKIRRMTGVGRRSGAGSNPGRGGSLSKDPRLALYKPN